MGVLWIIFCSTTDKKKIKRNNYQILFSKLDIHKIYSKNKKKKKIPIFKHEKTKQKSVINKRGRKNK